MDRKYKICDTFYCIYKNNKIKIQFNIYVWREGKNKQNKIKQAKVSPSKPRLWLRCAWLNSRSKATTRHGQRVVLYNLQLWTRRISNNHVGIWQSTIINSIFFFANFFTQKTFINILLVLINTSLTSKKHFKTTNQPKI